MFTSIAGRVVVITGGTRGIGRGIAGVFARNGARVLITGRDSDTARAAATELTRAASTADEPGEVSFVQADVASREDCRRVAAVAQEHFGGIDVLCANAGIFPKARVADLTEEELDQVLDINLKGTVFSVQACLPALARSGRGRIILVSSITGPITGSPGWAHYGASKAGQLGFMRTAATELARSGITVNSVLPGNILTEDDPGEAAARKVAASIPMRRLGTVGEIGYAALFLTTDEAAYITGQTIVVDGGQVLPEFLIPEADED